MLSNQALAGCFIGSRYILRTIRERKLRTALLVLSVAVSAGLFFASTALTTSLAGMYADRLQETYGNAEIVVEPHPRGWSSFISPALVQDARGGIEYAVGVFEDTAYYRRQDTAMRMSLTAVAFEDLVTMDRMSLAAEARLLPFRGHKAIIGSHTASTYEIAAGDYVRLEINGVVYRFRVAGIAHPAGMFIDDAESPAVVVPRDFMAALYGARGQVETLYIKALEGQDKQQLIERLEQVFRRNRVRESVSERDVREWTREITVPLQIMLVLVLLTAGFIKHTAFQVITTERLPVIGTFRSIGATRRHTSAVLFLESALYGCAGGFAGCALGIGALYVIARWSTPAWLAEDGIRIEFTALQLASTVLVAVGLALASSAIPIVRASRMPIRALVLGEHQSRQRPIGRRSMVGVVLVMLALVVPTLAPSLLNAVAGIVAGVIGERFLKHDGLQQWYDELYVKTDRDPDAVKDDMQRRFNRRDPWIRTVAEMEEYDQEANRELLRGLEGFAFMALAIAVIGVVNNLLIGFIERRRSLALFRSVGMEQRQVARMLLVEALMSGAVGGLVGVGAAFLLLYVADYVILALELYVLIRYSAALIAAFFLVGVGVTVLASVSPALKARRIDLLRELRHE